MKKSLTLFLCLFLVTTAIKAQSDTAQSTFLNPQPRNYQVRQALEFESLVPMFFTGGFHFAVCYRYQKFRLRASVINGGRYNAEPAGLDNTKASYKRYYKTSPGFFAGYNVWKNLEAYTFLEFHTFEIEQKNTGLRKEIHSTDFGGGVSYQFFLGRYFYIQPGIHIYLRGDNNLDFNNEQYNIPNIDLAPVLRVGVRYWRRY